MPIAPTREVKTPADRLRELLTEAEIALANLKGAGQKAERLLYLLDDLENEHTKLSQSPIDLRPEEGRIDGVCSSLRRQKALFLRELGRTGGLGRLREERKPPENAWWWFLDRELAEERVRRARHYGTISLGLAILIAIGVVIYRQFFAPDPLVVEIYSNQTLALDEIMQGDYAGAIPYMEKNLELAPEDPEWPIRLGVLEEIAGDPTRSPALFALGQALSATEVNFYLQRAQAYSELDSSEKVLQDAEQALQLDDSLPMAYLLLGRSHAELGNHQEAIEAYEKVIALTEDVKGEETIYVVAKVEMVRVLQAPPANLSPTDE